MARIEWANNGEADANGKYRVSIDCEDGGGIQVFEGENHQDIANKLLNAQANATVKIRELAGRAKIEPAAPRSRKPAPITDDERFQLVTDINDPTKAPEAVRRLVEGATGIAFDKLAAKSAEEDKQEQIRKAIEEAEAFAASTPAYYSTTYNGNLLCEYIVARKGALTQNNFGIAFAALSKSGLLQPNPATTSTEGAPAHSQPEGGAPGGLPTAATTRQRGVISSTAIRSGDSTSGSGGGKAPQKYTIEQIEAMSGPDYERRLKGEAGFAAAVDALYKARK